MKLFSFDPGVHQVACAEWSGDELRHVTLLTFETVFELTKFREANLFDAARVVIECPQVYARGKGDPNDLIDLARVVGALETLSRDCVVVRPRTWKGTLPKKIHHERVLKELTTEERAVLGTKKKIDHNILDAVGLGLWALKRL